MWLRHSPSLAYLAEKRGLGDLGSGRDGGGGPEGTGVRAAEEHGDEDAGDGDEDDARQGDEDDARQGDEKG
jgi:hypothetical protein